MPNCRSCGQAHSVEAKFCGSCGRPVTPSAPRKLDERDLRKAPRNPEWMTLDDVLYTRDKRFGAIGVLLAFFGAFAPWASTSVSFFGLEVGSFGVNSPQAWLIAMAAIAAAIFLFRQRSGSTVLVLGIIIGAWAILFALTTFSNNSSPSWGVLLTIAGGALLAYSGHMTNQYERSA